MTDKEEQVWVDLQPGEIIQKEDRLLAYGSHWESVEDKAADFIGLPWDPCFYYQVQRLK